MTVESYGHVRSRFTRSEKDKFFICIDDLSHPVFVHAIGVYDFSFE